MSTARSPGWLAPSTGPESAPTLSSDDAGAPISERAPISEPPDSDLPVYPGTMVGDRYVVDRVIASGGMGIVCIGRHVELDRVVAIKFLRRSLSRNAALVARFLNEARAAAALRSEHVVRVMDVGQTSSGLPYLVMEHLDGIDLDTLVEREGPLSVERAIGYALEACEALSEAHAAGIVHRDIKPENLFLCSTANGSRIVKVVDFGIAKRLDGARAKVVTGPQESMGSPCYMSPEQIAAPSTVDARTDVWSMGVVLYRLLTGSVPFDGDSVVHVFANVLNAPAPALSTLNPEIDPELDRIVRRCLEKDPARRCSSIVELASELRSYTTSSRTTEIDPLSFRPGAATVPPERPQRRSALAAFAFPIIAVIGAGLSAAEGSGIVRLRALAEGWLVPAPLSLHAALEEKPRALDVRAAGQITRGVYSEHPAFVAGEPALAALPERGHEDAEEADEVAVLSSAVVATKNHRDAAVPEESAPESDFGVSEAPSAPIAAEQRLEQLDVAEAERALEQETVAETAPGLTQEEIERRRRDYRAFLRRNGLKPIGEALRELEQPDPEAPPARN